VSRKHVAVLFGGRSLERDVSLLTGHRVVSALRDKEYRVTPIDVDESLVRVLTELRPDAAFIAMHGKGGEDGTVQELLEILDIPYTGSGVLASIKAMDKVLTKHILQAEGIPTPAFYAFNDAAFREMGAKDALDIIASELGLPIVVKPAAQGSALGINFAAEARDLPRCMLSALSFDHKVLLETYVRGRELAVSVLGAPDAARALPIVEACPRGPHSYYDFDSRYVVGATDFSVPAELDPTVQAEVERLALATYRALGCTGFGRVDFILDAAGTPWVLELNTIPGLTETSTMPMAAEAAGLSFEDLVDAVTRMALEGAR
jgi:D-alanine-D-alanine ligase